jgi:hypothetical protein
LFKAEGYPPAPTVAFKFATIQWFDNRRLLEGIGSVPPASAEARSDSQAEVQALAT